MTRVRCSVGCASQFADKSTNATDVLASRPSCSLRCLAAPEAGMSKRARRFDLRKTLFLLPNLITLSAVFCGFDSIRRSATAEVEDDFYRAALLIIFAMFFDMLDGRVARLTKTQSAFGLQIDSL